MSQRLINEKTDHLILLVGKNPLPNYVAAQLLLKKGGTLYLLHSDETRKVADRIEKALNLNAKRDEIKEADAIDIAQKIESWVDKIPHGESIGLNYTGGTKMMAVHAHYAFLQAMKANHPNQTPVCSYLDARSYEMKFDPSGGDGGYGVKVLKSVDVSLETLLALHNIQLQNSPDIHTMLPKSTQILASLHTCSETAKKWRHWCDDELRGKTRNGNNWIESQTKLASITLNLPTDDVFAELNKQLCEELDLPPNGTIPLREVKSGQIFKKTYHILKWLDGIWLEHYVFDEIMAIAGTVGINHTAMSFDTIRGAGKPDFEFDVGAMKGYQLFGLSCSTTQDKGMPKSKLFEAYIRAKQLGGDEARMALVCPQPGLKKKLEKELPESIQGKVRIFDSAHLENLRDELQDWFEYA